MQSSDTYLHGQQTVNSGDDYYISSKVLGARAGGFHDFLYRCYHAQGVEQIFTIYGALEAILVSCGREEALYSLTVANTASYHSTMAVSRAVTPVKSHQTRHLRHVHFTVSRLYFRGR